MDVMVIKHIERTLGVAGGKPRIVAHRITVDDIVIWHEGLGRTPDEIVAEYGLSLADAYAAPAYYFDNREAVGRSISEGEACASALRRRTPSKLIERLRGGD